MENEQPGKAQQIMGELTEYVNLRFDSLKLSMVEGLAVIFSNAMAVIIAMLLGMMALMVLTTALIIFLSGVFGSLLWALMVVGVVYLFGAWLFFSLRGKFMIDTMVKMLSSIFFTSKSDRNEAEE